MGEFVETGRCLVLTVALVCQEREIGVVDWALDDQESVRGSGFDGGDIGDLWGTHVRDDVLRGDGVCQNAAVVSIIVLFYSVWKKKGRIYLGEQ